MKKLIIACVIIIEHGQSISMIVSASRSLNMALSVPLEHLGNIRQSFSLHELTGPIIRKSEDTKGNVNFGFYKPKWLV